MNKLLTKLGTELVIKYMKISNKDTILVYNQVYICIDKAGAQVRDRVKMQVYIRVWDQVRVQVLIQVYDQVQSQVWDHIGIYINENIK